MWRTVVKKRSELPAIQFIWSGVGLESFFHIITSDYFSLIESRYEAVSFFFSDIL